MYWLAHHSYIFMSATLPSCVIRARGLQVITSPLLTTQILHSSYITEAHVRSESECLFFLTPGQYCWRGAVVPFSNEKRSLNRSIFWAFVRPSLGLH